MTVTFEGYERRADKINKCLADNGIASLEEALQICTDKGFNPREIVNNNRSRMPSMMTAALSAQETVTNMPSVTLLRWSMAVWPFPM